MPDPTPPVSRRHFLHASGLGLGGLLAAGATTMPTATAAARAAGAPAAPIGVQLYTLRTRTERDMPGTLKQVADIGYREVEFAGYARHDPTDVRAMLDRLGLTAPSAHVPVEALRADMGQVLAAATVVGHQYIICPFYQARTLDDWRRAADEFNRFGAAARARGVQFAYHNHHFEFTPVDGRLPYDVLLDGTDPALVLMEMDLFWTIRAGQDPVAYFERHPGRFRAVHVKDMRDIPGAQRLAPLGGGDERAIFAHMTEVGSGDIDFRRLFARATHAGIRHYVVEHDQPADPLASVRTSYGNLRQLLA